MPKSMPMQENTSKSQSVDGDLPIKLSDYSSLKEILKQRFSEKHSKQIFTSLLFIEFDDLSRFNDAFGFNIDDTLMLKISDDISLFLNRKDIIARVGNHQFIIIQDHSSSDSAGRLAKRIIHMLSEPCIVDEHMFYIHASIGISLYPIDGEDVCTLIKVAENTMKSIQEDSKTHIGFFKDSTVIVPCEKNIQIMADLPAAIENGEIYFLYQPQYSHREKRFVGAELLSRWEHPQYGEISPELFIPIAEQNGMIGPLTIKALVAASKAFTLFKNEGINDFSLSINVSPVFLMASSFDETIEFLIEQYGLRGKKLNFEITEEIVLKNTDNLIKTLEKLKSLDINIELDDFGTGYTSLQHLAYLPIDTLKIDKSFVNEIDKDVKKKALFKAIVDMSHALDINVIAEGVENSTEDNVIKTFDSITVQGYFYSKPMHLDMLVEKLNSKWKKK
jgi:diguanylate cyclase (GGDEF)-like protein